MNSRLPTKAEWEAEQLTWSSDDADGAFASPLRLVLAGYRNGTNGFFYAEDVAGYYWSSSIDGTFTHRQYFDNSFASTSTGDRTYGLSVRCIKD